MPRVVIDDSLPLDFAEMRERMSRLHLQSLFPHPREDPIVIVVNETEVGTRGWLARDVGRLMELQVEVSQNG